MCSAGVVWVHQQRKRTWHEIDFNFLGSDVDMTFKSIWSIFREKGKQLAMLPLGHVKVMSNMDRSLSLRQLRAASRVLINFVTVDLTTSAGKMSLLQGLLNIGLQLHCNPYGYLIGQLI